MADDGDEKKKPEGLGRRALKAGGKAAAAAATTTGLTTGDGQAAAISAGVAFVGGAGGALVEAGIEAFKGATARLEEAAEHEKAQALEDAREELGVKLERLSEELDDTRALVSDFRATLHAWSRAWDRTGDAKKRRILMAALLRAFDRDAYEAGLTLRLFRILESLDYPEIWFLREGFTPEGDIKHAEGRTDPGPGALVEGAEIREHMEQLRTFRLVGWEGAFGGPQHSGATRNARRTWLGGRLLELCADSEALARVWPEPKAEGETDS